MKFDVPPASVTEALNRLNRPVAYVLVATAVYDQGVVGVYTGPNAEQDARDAAAEIWPKTDGHHGFRIDKLELNKTYENAFGYQFYRTRKPTKPDPPIEIDDRTAAPPETYVSPRRRFVQPTS